MGDLTKLCFPDFLPSDAACRRQGNGPCLGSRKAKQPYEWMSYGEVRVNPSGSPKLWLWSSSCWHTAAALQFDPVLVGLSAFGWNLKMQIKEANGLMFPFHLSARTYRNPCFKMLVTIFFQNFEKVD